MRRSASGVVPAASAPAYNRVPRNLAPTLAPSYPGLGVKGREPQGWPSQKTQTNQSPQTSTGTVQDASSALQNRCSTAELTRQINGLRLRDRARPFARFWCLSPLRRMQCLQSLNRPRRDERGGRATVRSADCHRGADAAARGAMGTIESRIPVAYQTEFNPHTRPRSIRARPSGRATSRPPSRLSITRAVSSPSPI